MLSKLLRAVLLVFILHFFLPVQGSAQNLSFLSDTTSYLWPTNATEYLSSTFAETRSAHLHSGIDIRTWGIEGYDVYATRDGLISRVGVSPVGYGNVIYLKHGDGSYSLYAHLNRFEDSIQEIVDSLRMETYSFEFNESFEEREIYVEQGELIGYTGSTGVGPPHLHFELRTPDNEPFNPLLTNLKDTVDDTLAPVFSALAVEGLNPNTLHLEGHTKLAPKETDSDTLHFGEFKTSAPVGLAVDVYDRANRTPNVYAVHQLIMVADSDTLFHSKADHFSFPEDQMMYLDRSYPILYQTRRGFQRLYTVNGNRLPMYKRLLNRGVLAFDEGTYTIKIIAKDIYDNRSVATVDLIFEDNTSIKNIGSVPAYPKPNRALESARNLSINPVPNRFLTDLIEVNNNAAKSNPSILLAEEDFGLIQHKLTPGKLQSMATSNQRAWISLPKNALYDTLEIKWQKTVKDGYPAFEFSPNRLPIQDEMYFGYRLPDEVADDHQIGLFAYDEYRDRFTFISSSISGGLLLAKLEEFTELRIKKDIHPPFAGTPRIEKNLGENYIVTIPTVDEMSGIDYHKSEITVNGRRGIIEYDPEKDLLIYNRPGFVPEEVNTVEFEIYDGIGNRTVRTRSVSYDNSEE